MTQKRVGIIMHGVTGRMGMNQHLIRSILEIRKQGGLALKNGDRLMPDPILVGRNAAKVEELAKQHGMERWSTDLDACMENKADSIFFDAASTQLRPKLLKKAIAAGKHIYCEKPVSTTLAEAKDLYAAAKKARIKHGVVQDKLWLPGMLKLKKLRDEGFFGKILSVRGEFGYWVFEGDRKPAQRPSWNYRKQDGGGIILDMLCHWRYVLDNLFGEVKSVSCLGATHIPKRWDEAGKMYKATSDDAAYATFQLAGVVARVIGRAFLITTGAYSNTARCVWCIIGSRRLTVRSSVFRFTPFSVGLPHATYQTPLAGRTHAPPTKTPWSPSVLAGSRTQSRARTLSSKTLRTSRAPLYGIPVFTKCLSGAKVTCSQRGEVHTMLHPPSRPAPGA